MIAQAKPRRREAILWSIACSALFMVVYGGCQWASARRPDAGVWYYDWESGMPFVPAMIVPYWSLDLLFVGSFFVCTGGTELRLLAKRIVMAILVAGLIFLVLPLHTAVPPPPATGRFAPLFALLRSFDRPTNLFPSLHVALGIILLDPYTRHTRGLLRAAVRVWFILIGLSSVLTYQHHVVDVAGGIGLATLCFYLWREPAAARRGGRNIRVGFLYAAGALAASAAAVVLPSGSGGMLFWWPALSLSLVSGGYFGLGPSIYRKEGGRIPVSARLLLGPCLLGQHLSWMFYRGRSRILDRVTPSLLIGRWVTGPESGSPGLGGVTAVLDLTAEFSEATPFLGRVYRNIPILDLTAPSPDQLREAVAFIRDEAARGQVYVHCKVGYSRTAAVVGAYLIETGRARTAEESIRLLRKARPSITVRPEALSAIRGFAPEPVA